MKRATAASIAGTGWHGELRIIPGALRIVAALAAPWFAGNLPAQGGHP